MTMPRRADAPRTAARRLLVLAEGDPDAVRVCVEMLRELGYDTDTVAREEDIAAACGHWPPAALLLELEGRGALIERLRVQQAGGGLPGFAIVGLTTMTAERRERDPVEDLIDGCLVRPLEVRQVAVTLARLVQTAPQMGGRLSSDEASQADPSDPTPL